MESNFTSLHESERLLLMSYHDSERDFRQLGMFDRWRLKRLIQQKPEAGQFLNLLAVISSNISQAVSENSRPLDKSLWTAIEQRIDQEERAAIYLGKRDVSENRAESFLAKLGTVADLNWSNLGWKVPGIAVAACGVVLMGSFFLSSPGFIERSASSVDRGASTSVAKISGSPQVSASTVRFASQQSELPQIIEPPRRGSQALSSVDVDWVHSDGAVRFFSDPQRNTTMIWVKKRTPVVRFYGPPATTDRQIGVSHPEVSLQGRVEGAVTDTSVSPRYVNEERH